MIEIVILISLVIILLILYFIFDVKLKQIKQAAENEELDKIVLKFPENKEICKNILKKLENQKVKIEEDDGKEASLYIAITDKILIGNIKKSYTRIQTIAHECLHSIQSRKMLIFNFMFSNIYIIYFIISIVLTFLGVFKNHILQIWILTIMSFIYYAVRSYLETDAMTKAKYEAKDYMEGYIKENNICTKKDIEKVVDEYDRINKLGIPATNYILFINCIIKVILYIIVAVII